MNRQPCNSSVIKSAGYDPVDRVMEVEFARGDLYLYYDVEPSIYADFVEAESKGAWFRSAMKGLVYEKVEAVPTSQPIPEGELLASDDPVLWAKQFMLRWGHKLRSLDEETMEAWFTNFKGSVKDAHDKDGSADPYQGR